MSISVLAFIPARGGSKALPNKNLLLLNGKPLIDYAINVAQDSRLFDRIVVSTDSSAIAERAISASVEVHNRPTHLSTDTSRVVDAVVHASEELNLNEHDIICVLQPTSPLRRASQVTDAVRKTIETGRPVISIVECEHHPLKTFSLLNGTIQAMSNGSDLEKCRQDLPKMYRPNGAIYVASVAAIVNSMSLVPPDALTIEMSARDSIDIDSALDLQVSEYLIQHLPRH